MIDLVIELHITRYEDDTVKPEKIIYPNNTIVIFDASNNKLDMSGIKNYIGEGLEIYSNGEFEGLYKIKNFYYREGNNGCVEYE